METGTLQRQCANATILATACIALAFLSTSCGPGGPVAIPAPADAPAVNLAPVSLSFADQAIATSSSAQSVTLTNTGSAALAISSIMASGDFGQTNNCGTSVAAGNNCTISVTFTPTATGTRTGAVTITDNASGSAQAVPLSGTGAHYVALSWTASTTSGVVGYNAYRGTASSGPFSQLNSSPVSGTTYTDAGVQAGQTFYYVVTAIASDGVTESANSNVASATVPSP
jgi:hypothetical protein